MEQIKITHNKFNEIIFRIFKSDPTIKYDFLWEDFGLTRVDKFKSGGVYFEVLDKTKLVHAMIKYDFTI